MQNLELLITREEENNGMFVCLKPKTPALITPKLVEDIRNFQDSIAEKYLAHPMNKYLFVIWYCEGLNKSSCQGLDFSYIVDCIKSNHESDFEHYIDRVFNLIFLNYIGLGFPIINCSIINRPLSGISNDFFLLNNICFVQDPTVIGINNLELFREFPNLVFDKELYERNHYFNYQNMEIDKIKSIIEEIDYITPDENEINLIQEKFDMKKDETITEIYNLAARNIKILERLAKIGAYPDLLRS
ncbi:hypothetical protein BN59_03367 [Legionella massiliensis]|uniref:Uncharacterized protein n=1 Tax=Legionella massiliensis TaxID=1034943 RepID=A0A078L1H3_9GAMM|nr:hypothetical protein [Legionella massiliensis]CDZ79051.1 hypothetical protein BN59_03367 [Legionella massiliensis]CEE14789.1 hypothetical protein BN1094_03367 [Legionella massiliensis]